ncbi:MAG: phenylalanine--tRNA ligase subunit alpha [Bacteroidales bacterium]|nr:phenylalanine--tRNA ligase subunit alpha [Bacteroidales bacterium]MCF8389678.1 phenylalanine--tRNA ligase subunit alpha [Bacteroidales bacterium]
MHNKISKFIQEAESFSAETIEQIEAFRIKFLSKKGVISELFEEFKILPGEQKKEVGQLLNQLKNTLQDRINSLKDQLGSEVTTSNIQDLSLPGTAINQGSRHPISIVRKEILDIFSRIGFTVSEGPEIEDDKHVFSALNFPPEHPARDMQDTFFIEKNPDILLRTHTSSIQVRVMENTRPPIRTVSPGRVFRNEAISARAHCIFHQVEGLYIDEKVSFADLKQTLLYFAKELFGEDTKIRLRPSYFPFTEPSAEMDVSCNLCGGKGCNVCKYTGWLEVLGCGMVDPNVLDFNNIDSSKYTGFAFGMGIERIAMLKFQIRDLRLYFENDLRFLEQFSSVV